MPAKIQTYEKAMARLEEIVAKVENNELSIDKLGTYLKEAQEQIAFCKKKLYETDQEIRKILDSFEEEA